MVSQLIWMNMQDNTQGLDEFLMTREAALQALDDARAAQSVRREGGNTSPNHQVAGRDSFAPWPMDPGFGSSRTAQSFDAESFNDP